MKSSVVYAAIFLCTFVRFETMIWLSIRFDISLQNCKKPLDIFAPQIERKRSKKHLVIILAVKESFKRFSCLEFIFEKRNYREAGLNRALQIDRNRSSKTNRLLDITR